MPLVDQGAQREMTLDEWCGRLPDIHRVNRELSGLRKNEQIIARVREIAEGDENCSAPKILAIIDGTERGSK